MARPAREIWLALLVAGTVVIGVLALGLLAAGPAPSQAQAATATQTVDAGPLVLTDRQGVYKVGTGLDVFVDPTGRATLDDILAPGFTGTFVPLSQLRTPTSQYAYWLRLRIANRAAPYTRWLLLYDNYRVNEVAVYTPVGSGYRAVRTGNTSPFSSREIPYHSYVFRLDPAPGGSETVYVRLYDTSGFASLSRLVVESQEAFSEHVQTEYFWAGVFYFVVLTVLFFDIIFLFALRERAVLSFVVFLTSVVLLSLSDDGLGHQFLWPNATGWAEMSLIVSAVVFVAALLVLTIAVLDVRRYRPRWATASWILVGALAVAAACRFFLGAAMGPVAILAVTVLLLAGFVMPLIIAVQMIPKQRGPALTFLLGFSAYLIVTVVALLMTTRSDSWNYEPWSRAAFVWLLLVFSGVIYQRINAVREDRERAREELIAKQEEALRIQTDLTRIAQESRDSIVAAYDTTLEGWARLLEERDKETEGHCRNVTELSVEFAAALGMEADDLVAMRRGALLHDVGKISIPDSILLKPGPLTPEEWDVMKQHPLLAYNALSGIPFLERALDIPVYHHERWDGSGYPYGLAGERIPLSARIFAIIDNWDALLSDRPYRKAWPVDDVVAYIEENAGICFDPEIVPVFIELVRQKDNVTCEEADDGR